MAFIPRPHEIYKHFKGGLYQITAIAEHTETGEQLVVYQALYGDFKTYARPLAMFTEKVDKEKYPDANQDYRFELLQQGIQPRTGEDVKAWEPGDRSRADENVKAQEPGDQPGSDRSGMDESTQTQAKDDQSRADEHMQTQEQPAEEECPLDPFVIEFLDADSYEQRLNMLAGLHHRITDEMLTTMAIACDVELGDGDTEERYEALKSCLLTLEKYECNRLR